MTDWQNQKNPIFDEVNLQGGKSKKISCAFTALVIGTILILLITFYYSRFPEGYFGLRKLEQSQAKWHGQNITHYKITVSFSGYGIYKHMPWIIEVQNDNVISLVDTQGNTVVFPSRTNDAYDDARYFTVNALFSEVKQAYEDNALTIQVSFNSTYGYPESIYIDPYSEPCCQDYKIEIQDFQVLPQ